MARIKKGLNSHKRRKKTLKLAKGFYGSASRHYRSAKTAVMRAQRSAFVGRKQKKRDFRKLWIARINAAARINGISYSRLINGLKLANVEVNRKMLAELAVSDAAAFTQLVEVAKSKLA
jgi:large subunit ribosomal protein L20